MPGRFPSLLCLVVLCLGVASAAAEPHQVGPIRIESPWARATAPRAPAGAAFVTLVNTGTQDDALVSAASPVARVVELHTHLMDGGIMRMRPVDSIAVPAGQAVALKPGGLHIMLIDLNHGLQEGDQVPITLSFEHAGSLDVTATVASIAAHGPTDMSKPGHGHHHGHH